MKKQGEASNSSSHIKSILLSPNFGESNQSHHYELPHCKTQDEERAS